MCKEHKENIKALNLKYSQISTDFPLSVNPGQCFILQMVAVVDRLAVVGSPYDMNVGLIFITLTF